MEGSICLRVAFVVIPYGLVLAGYVGAFGWASFTGSRNCWPDLLLCCFDLAGCGQSLGWAHIYLFDVLEELYWQWRPVGGIFLAGCPTPKDVRLC